MALTNLFRLFGGTSSNLYTDAQWDELSERNSAFISGTVANSKAVNTAIKTNSLIAVSFIDAIKSFGGAVSVGLSTSQADLGVAINQALVQLSKDSVKATTQFTKTAGTPASGDTLSLKIDGTSINTFSIDNAANAGTAVKATYDSQGAKTIRSYGASLSVSNADVSLKDADNNVVSTVTVNNVEKASKDASGQTLTSTYVKSLSASEFTITPVKGDGTNGTSITVGINRNAVQDGTDLSLVTTGEKYQWATKGTGSVTSITLTSGEGISVSNSGEAITTSGTRTITNTGVRSITTGTLNGTIAVNTNGTISNVSVKGLGSNAYTSTTIPTITLNETASTTANFYAPTTFGGSTISKRYLIGSSSTSNLITENTNSQCYMQNNALYSENKKVSTIDTIDNTSSAIKQVIFDENERHVWLLIPTNNTSITFKYHAISSSAQWTDVTYYGMVIISRNANSSQLAGVKVIGQKSSQGPYIIDEYNAYSDILYEDSFMFAYSGQGTLVALVG